jgi:hypothetical protein
MPASKPQRKRSAAATKLPMPKKPSTPYPGYITDEWYHYAMECMKRVTPQEVRRDLVKFGIVDKKGNYTAPYRNE